MRRKCCPHCGSKAGFISRQVIEQMWDEDYEGNLLDTPFEDVVIKEIKLVKCIDCGKKFHLEAE